MRFSRQRLRSFVVLFIHLYLAQGCAKIGSPDVSGVCQDASFSGTSYSAIGNYFPSASPSPNVVSVTVNGANCVNGTGAYPNQPCVSVTLCSPQNPLNCQTISNILLDTGSYGLRLFKSAISVPLVPISKGNSTLTECVSFADGTSEFGPVEYAYIQLGNEPKVAVPILVIDPNYLNYNPPAQCSSSQSIPDTSASTSGYNGILGVGLKTQDCGSLCTEFNNGQYFACENNNCSCSASVDLTAQVTNPVAALPIDKNGVILQLPSIAAGGAATTSGSLILGIDTESNNSSSGKTKYYTDSNGLILTKFSAYSSSTLCSFLDSGSNALLFPPPTAGTLPDCVTAGYASSYTGYYCPTTGTSVSLTAVNANYNFDVGTQNTVSFSIQNGYDLLNSGNLVFSTLGASNLGEGCPDGGAVSFDWGLPFFYGKSVYVGFENNSSGSYWTY